MDNVTRTFFTLFYSHYYWTPSKIRTTSIRSLCGRFNYSTLTFVRPRSMWSVWFFKNHIPLYTTLVRTSFDSSRSGIRFLNLSNVLHNSLFKDRLSRLESYVHGFFTAANFQIYFNAFIFALNINKIKNCVYNSCIHRTLKLLITYSTET